MVKAIVTVVTVIALVCALMGEKTHSEDTGSVPAFSLCDPDDIFGERCQVLLNPSTPSPVPANLKLWEPEANIGYFTKTLAYMNNLFAKAFSSEAIVGPTSSVVKLFAIYSSGLVLAEDEKHVVEGYTLTPDLTKVTVEIDGIKRSTTDFTGGKWSVKFPKHDSTPVGYYHQIIVTAKSSAGTYDPMTIDNVVYGIVFGAGGQSNNFIYMRFMQNGAQNITDCFTHSGYNIRAMNAANYVSYNQNCVANPLDDIEPQYRWTSGGNDTCVKLQTDVLGSLPYWGAVELYKKYNGTKYIGIHQHAIPGTRIESWSQQSSIDLCRPIVPYPPSSVTGNFIPKNETCLANSMLAPLQNFPLSFYVWYQVESNGHNPDNYECLFPKMVTDFREMKDQKKMIFMYVQGAPYVGSAALTTLYTESRKRQRSALALKNVFELLTGHLGDYLSATSPAAPLHPSVKLQIAKQIVQVWANEKLGENVLLTPPIATNAYLVTNRTDAVTIAIVFDNTDTGVSLQNAPRCQTCNNRNLLQYATVDNSTLRYLDNSRIFNTSSTGNVQYIGYTLLPGESAPTQFKYIFEEVSERRIMSNAINPLPVDAFNITIGPQFSGSSSVATVSSMVLMTLFVFATALMNF